MFVQHRHAQDRARAIAGLAVDFRIETRIGIGIGNIDCRARSEHFTGDTEVGGNADLAFGKTFRDPRPQFFAGMVVQKQGTALGIEQIGSNADDLAQQLVDIEFCRHRLGHR